MTRTLSDADINALAEVLVPKIEERLAQRFFEAAGRGVLFGFWQNIAKPILIALVFLGLVALVNHPQVIAQAVEKAGK